MVLIWLQIDDWCSGWTHASIWSPSAGGLVNYKAKVVGRRNLGNSWRGGAAGGSVGKRGVTATAAEEEEGIGFTAVAAENVAGVEEGIDGETDEAGNEEGDGGKHTTEKASDVRIKAFAFGDVGGDKSDAGSEQEVDGG